jgi:hypothetical protein
MDRRIPNSPDATDEVGPAKFRRAIDTVEQQYDDRWPARGPTGGRSRDYRPLEDVSREGRIVEYKKRPNARG